MSIFNKVPVQRLKRTPHVLSYPVKFSCQFGQEQVTALEKCIPGDTILFQHAHRVDFAPLSTKLLQEFRIKHESFFVPTRILWPEFEKFFVAEDTSIIHPYIDLASVINYHQGLFKIYFTDTSYPTQANSLAALFSPRGLLYAIMGDVQGLAGNRTLGTDGKLDALRVYAYFRVMSEYYFDENLQEYFIDLLSQETFNEFYVDGSGDMSAWFVQTIFRYIYAYLEGEPFDGVPSVIDSKDLSDYVCYLSLGWFMRNYPKDYFTGCLPWKQKGEAVMIPQEQSEVRFFIQNEHQSADSINNAQSNFLAFQNNATTPPSGYKGVNLVGRQATGTGQGDQTYIKGVTGIGSGVTSIEDFRTAYQLQSWLEKNARGGTRYKEQILSHFGVKTKDSRLNRPEFLLGTTDVVNHGDVFTTYQDESGNGVPAESVTRLQAAGRSRRVGYYVTEHGYFINLFCIFPKANYAQGIFRQALELDKFDYFWPEFQHLGEQEVYRMEVNAASANPKSVFGYVPRYAQYKSRQPVVRGEFVSNLTTFTDYRILPTNTNLNFQFIAIDPIRNNLNRIFNVVTAEYDKIYPEVYNQVVMYRPMDYYGIPRLIL